MRYAIAAMMLAAMTMGAAGADQTANTGAPDEPAQYRTGDYRSPTPLTLKGAAVVSGAEAMALWKAAGTRFIDVLPRPRKPEKLPPQTVWHVPEHLDIPGSVWLPDTGRGVLSPSAADYFQQQLQRVTGGDRAVPLLFYCLKNCWMSWNAAKRALALGYTSVTWFPGGTDGWTEIGGPLQPAAPAEPVP